MRLRVGCGVDHRIERSECKLTKRYTFRDGRRPPMPRNAEPTRRRILEAAYELFYRMGFARVGVDEVAAFAGVTKRTLAPSFPEQGRAVGGGLGTPSRTGAGARPQIRGSLFPAALRRWSRSCSRNSPAGRPNQAGPRRGSRALPWSSPTCRVIRPWAVARRHKAALEAWWTDLLAAAGVRSAKERARGNCSAPRLQRAVQARFGSGIPASVRRMASSAPTARRRAVSMTERISA